MADIGPLKGQIIEEEDLAGKTIRRARLDQDGISLVFDDGTFFYACMVGADEEVIRDIDIWLECERAPDAWAQRHMGLIDREQYDALIIEERRQCEERERAEYERLRAKFEGQPAVASEG